MLLKCIFKLFLNCICLGSRALLLQEYVLCVFFLMGTGLRHRRLLGITFPVSPFTMHHYLNLAVTLNTTWLQSLPHVPLFYFYFFLRPNGSIFRYLASLESGMICEKFLQFMTATCSLGHRLITSDQAWKHAGAICCSPYWGALQCCLINSTASHSEPYYQLCASQLIWENVGSVRTGPWQTTFLCGLLLPQCCEVLCVCGF